MTDLCLKSQSCNFTECCNCGGKKNQCARTCFTKKKRHVVSQANEVSDSDDKDALYVGRVAAVDENG